MKKQTKPDTKTNILINDVDEYGNMNLVVITSFTISEGATFYDPTLLPFLHTLTELTPGQGYWVKVRNAVPNFTYPL